MSRWLAGVVALLLRSHPFRGLLALSALAAFVVVATSTSVAALQLAPSQQAASLLGDTEAMVELVDSATASPGHDLPAPSWLPAIGHKAGVIAVAKTMVPLGSAGEGQEQTLYRELVMPSPALAGNTTLERGAWPSEPGECVTTGSPQEELDSPLGSWKLTVVGSIRDIYSPALRETLCAPGTWKTWHLGPGEEQASRFAISAEYYFTGEPNAVASAIGPLVNDGTFGESATVEWRQQLSAERPVSAQRFLGDRAPLLAIPSALAAIAAGLLARWGGAVSRALSRAGVPERPMRRAMVGTAVMGAASAAAVCGAAGAAFAAMVRPLLSGMNAGRPLSPWRLPLDDIGLVALVSALGALLGYWVGDGARATRLRQSDDQPNPLSSVASVLLAAAAGVAAAVSIWLVLASDGRSWWMIASVVFMAGASCFGAPVAVLHLSRALSGRDVSAAVLGGRIVCDDSRRWSGVASGVTLVLSLAIALFSVSAASVAGQVLLAASQVPAGSVLLETTDASGRKVPKSVQTQLEHDLGIARPIRITELEAYVPERGFVQLLDSSADARIVLGDLPDDAWSVLERGGLVTFGGTSVSATTMIQIGEDSLVTVPQISIRPTPDHRYSTGAGFALLRKIPGEVRAASLVRTWNLYRGLNPSQDAQARSWSTTTGMNAFQVLSYRPSDVFSLPTWTTIALLGFGLMLAPALALALRREARALRPIAATMRRVGVRRSWMRPAFASVVGLIVGTAIVLSVAASSIVLALLVFKYPTVFDLAGVPWWMLGVFVSAVGAASYFAVVSAMASLDRRDMSVTI